MSAKAAVAIEEWIPKAQAARLLGVSLRQLERREQNGYIEKRTMPRLPTESTGRVLYSRADLLALKAGKPNVHARVLPEKSQADSTAAEPASTARPASTALARIPDADPFAGLAARLAGLAGFAAQYGPAPAKPWLTLEEAVEASGLTRGWLLNQAIACADSASDAEAGAIRDMGKHARGGRWRFNRDWLGAGK